MMDSSASRLADERKHIKEVSQICPNDAIPPCKIKLMKALFPLLRSFVSVGLLAEP